MPTFDTPEPITVEITLGMGDVRITATDRRDTVVEVRPSRTRPGDVTAAEQTRVEFTDNRLLVSTPKGWRSWSPFGDGGSVDVTIELPAGSRVTGDAAMATFHGIGRLGECRIKTAMGNIELEEAATVRLRTSAGDVALERIAGDADLSTASGSMRIGRVDGAVVVKSSNGDTHVAEVTGELRVRGANGDIEVGHTGGSVVVKTARGDIRLGAAAAGAVEAQTAFGGIDIGICEGAAAWLDLQTSYGHIHNGLGTADGPEPGEGRVQVRARTSMGDITIRRSPLPARLEAVA